MRRPEREGQQQEDKGKLKGKLDSVFDKAQHALEDLKPQGRQEVESDSPPRCDRAGEETRVVGVEPLGPLRAELETHDDADEAAELSATDRGSTDDRERTWNRWRACSREAESPGERRGH